MNKRPLAIFGGTFDPVHIGHLRVAWEAAEQLGAEVRLLPASVPPHRPQPRATAEQRLELLHISLRGQQRLNIDARELARTGPSYTIDTLIELRAEIGAGRPLVLLVGADAWAGLPSWHRWNELFDYAHIGVLTRAGCKAAESEELAAIADPRRVASAGELALNPAGSVIDLNVSALDISATQIRHELAEGREPRFLLAEGLFEDPEYLAPYRSLR
jgi:nicotinate-nucleotide adenylyltransferase